jgi:hypothetical protein
MATANTAVRRNKKLRPVRYPLAKSATGTLIFPASGAKGSCRDCNTELIAKCGDTLTNHWAHKPGLITPACRTGVSTKHLFMQGFMVGLLDPLGKRNARIEYSNRQARRRADVAIDMPLFTYILEMQVSPIKLVKMEGRTRDWNRQGHPVLWVFDHEIFTQHGNKLSMKAWAFKWTTRRSWRQGYVIDDDARLWWFRVLGDDYDDVKVTMVEVTPGMQPQSRGLHTQPAIRLICDTNRVNGKNPLVIGAFCWVGANPAMEPILNGHQPKWTSLRNLPPLSGTTTPQAVWK